MNTEPTQDAHSLAIALRLAQAQIRDLQQQLAETKSQQWQPIEAPEENISDIYTPIVLWYPSHEAILYGAWDHRIEEWREWITDGSIVDSKPTHWMPLPAPPTEDDQ